MISTTEFKIKKTKIPGLLEIDIDLIIDARGWFQEKFQRQKLIVQGFPKDFKILQHSLSFNKTRGVTRGFHAEPWDKYVSVINGEVFAVLVDLRKENFGKIVTVNIDNTKAIFIPKGVANCFQTVKDGTYYSYLINDLWSEKNMEKYKFFNLVDPKILVQWPIPLSQAIISDKDTKHPFLKDLKPY